MKQDFENPFADYGTIVHGERFIGRRDDLQVIESRVIRPREPGNLAIIGDSRIGKSSLVYRAVIDRKDELIAKRFLPIWISLSNYEHAHVFFRSLVMICVNELTEVDWLTESIKKSAERAIEDELSWSEKYGRIQRFFERVRREGTRILFILDEFDHARHLFRRNTSAFQGLRELSYRPEWRVSYIITARRTIHDIELQTQAISTFDGIFHKHYLGMFGAEDVEEYFNRLASVGILDNDSLRGQLGFYCGGHPYLLELFGYELVEFFRENRVVNVDQVAQRSLHSFLDQYDRMIELMREEGTLSKLLQALVGPVFDVKWTDVETLLKYGFIKRSEHGYIAFSEHFQTYLNLVARDWDLWPIWRETEKTLRKFITQIMVRKYGESWIEKLERANPQLKKAVFDNCRRAQKKEEKAFGNRASKNLIDFTYPQDLFTIMFAEWNTFSEYLDHDKNYWGQRSQFLGKIRNPLAHNRDESLHEYERQIVEGYCKEILEKINEKLA